MGEGGLVGSALGDTEMVGAGVPGVATGSWQLDEEDLQTWHVSDCCHFFQYGTTRCISSRYTCCTVSVYTY